MGAAEAALKPYRRRFGGSACGFPYRRAPGQVALASPKDNHLPAPHVAHSDLATRDLGERAVGTVGGEPDRAPPGDGGVAAAGAEAPARCAYAGLAYLQPPGGERPDCSAGRAAGAHELEVSACLAEPRSERRRTLGPAGGCLGP
jgi:hypothetical protein